MNIAGLVILGQKSWLCYSIVHNIVFVESIHAMSERAASNLKLNTASKPNIGVDSVVPFNQNNLTVQKCL